MPSRTERWLAGRARGEAERCGAPADQSERSASPGPRVIVTLSILLLNLHGGVVVGDRLAGIFTDAEDVDAEAGSNGGFDPRFAEPSTRAARDPPEYYLHKQTVQADWPSSDLSDVVAVAPQAMGSAPLDGYPGLEGVYDPVEEQDRLVAGNAQRSSNCV